MGTLIGRHAAAGMRAALLVNEIQQLIGVNYSEDTRDRSAGAGDNEGRLVGAVGLVGWRGAGSLPLVQE
jgi:hypothetical protein